MFGSLYFLYFFGDSEHRFHWLMQWLGIGERCWSTWLPGMIPYLKHTLFVCHASRKVYIPQGPIRRRIWALYELRQGLNSGPKLMGGIEVSSESGSVGFCKWWAFVYREPSPKPSSPNLSPPHSFRRLSLPPFHGFRFVRWWWRILPSRRFRFTEMTPLVSLSLFSLPPFYLLTSMTVHPFIVCTRNFLFSWFLISGEYITV